jgi:hypothetical protein
LEVVEPLRPRPPADPAPPDRVRDTRGSLAIEEESMDSVTAGDVKWVSEHPDSGADGEQPDPAVPPDPALMTEGRVLLRILEHGSGPTVEIAWPADPGERRRLFRRFESCFEMRLALMDLQGRLFTADGPRGRSWDLNLDRYSSFVRQTNGRLTAAEQGHIQDIRAFHGGLNGAAPVRIFPRRTDALLLGGLRQLTGDGYEHAKSIHASYRIVGDRVLVEAIQADGRPVHGNLDLSRAADPSCRGRSPT